MRVKITQAHIDNGIEADYSNCAGVIAVKEQTGAYRVKIDAEMAYIQMKNGGKVKAYKLSGPFREFVFKFDQGETVKPAVFSIIPTYQYVKMFRNPKVKVVV